MFPHLARRGCERAGAGGLIRGCSAAVRSPDPAAGTRPCGCRGRRDRRTRRRRPSRHRVEVKDLPVLILEGSRRQLLGRRRAHGGQQCDDDQADRRPGMTRYLWRLASPVGGRCSLPNRGRRDPAAEPGGWVWAPPAPPVLAGPPASWLVLRAGGAALPRGTIARRSARADSSPRGAVWRRHPAPRSHHQRRPPRMARASKEKEIGSKTPHQALARGERARAGERARRARWRRRHRPDRVTMVTPPPGCELPPRGTGRGSGPSGSQRNGPGLEERGRQSERRSLGQVVAPPSFRGEDGLGDNAAAQVVDANRGQRSKTRLRKPEARVPSPRASWVGHGTRMYSSSVRQGRGRDRWRWVATRRSGCSGPAGARRCRRGALEVRREDERVVRPGIGPGTAARNRTPEHPYR